MDFQDLIAHAKNIKESYAVLNRQENARIWTANEYAQGLIGDIGDLNKLLMAKHGYRFADIDVDRKIEQELADCIWSLIMLADELEIDLEGVFRRRLDQLQDKIGERKVLKPKKMDL
jgi:NTP pyrophosphatase (non-canonical NTP hydrolase)